MALEKDDARILADALTKSLQALGFRPDTRPSGRTTTPSRTSRSSDPDEKQKRQFGELQKKLMQTTRKMIEIDQETLETSLRAQRLQKQHTKVLQETISSLSSFSGAMIRAGDFKQVVVDFQKISKNSEGLTSELAKATKNASQFSAALIESYELIDKNSAAYERYISNLGAAASKLDKSFLRSEKLIDAMTGELRKDLDPAEFAAIRRKIGVAQTMMAEQMKSLGLTDIAQLTKEELEKRLTAAPTFGKESADETQRALINIAQQLESQKLLGKTDLSDPSRIDYVELAKNVKRVSESMGEAATEMDRQAKRVGALGGKDIKGGFEALKDKLTDFKRGLVDNTKILAAWGVALNGAKKSFDEIVNFNIAHLATSFIDVQVQSAKMGMSLEDTVSFMQENKQLLALQGPKEFGNLIDGFKGTFQDFGYTMKQGAESIGPTVNAAISQGIDVRSGDKLNKYMAETMTAHQKIAGVLKISLGEYSKMNAELFEEADIKSTLAGLDSQQAKIYGDNLKAQRDEMATRLNSIQQAQELIKLQERAKQEKVSERVRGAAMLAMQAQQAGMGAEAGEMMRLELAGKTATPEETKRLTELKMQLGAARAEMQAQYVGAGAGFTAQQMAQELRTEATPLTASTEAIVKLGETAAQQAKANATLTDAQKKAAQEASKGKESVAEFGNTANTASALINNSFIAAVGGAAAASGMMAAQAFLAARALGTLSAAAGGKGILETVSDAFGGKGKGAPGVPGTVAGGAKFSKGLAALTALGGVGAGFELGDIQQQEKAGQITAKESTVKSAGVVGGFAGASTAGLIGMGVGQALIPVPILGAAIGGIVGGALGGWLAKEGTEAIAGAIVSDVPSKPTAIATPMAPPSVVQPGSSVSTNAVNTTVTALTATGPPDVLKVADKTSNEKLEAISASLIDAVAFLKLIAVNSNETKTTEQTRTIPGAKTIIPTQSSYMSGRG